MLSKPNVMEINENGVIESANHFIRRSAIIIQLQKELSAQPTMEVDRLAVDLAESYDDAHACGEQPLGTGSDLGEDTQRLDKPLIRRASLSFPPESWESDRQDRYEIGPLTAAFHRSVPSLKFLNWSIEDISRGKAVTRLPLNVESSNQYITQQAALMLLAADYTGGIALSTLFEHTPIIGFHPQRTDFGAYLWGAAATTKWLRPSTDDLICSSIIPEKDWDDIARTFARGEEVRYKARIKMHSGGRLAAVCDFQYWARSSHSLRATGENLQKTHHMLTHKLRTSARLIAGLRSKHVVDGATLDPYAKKAAGPQGLAMAEKFSQETPQLFDLVRARTQHCDDALKSFASKHKHFVVVNIGSGYDARPWRLKSLGEAVFAGLDLSVMIKDRQQVLPSASDSPYRIIDCGFDILRDDLDSALRAAGVPLHLPKFFIWEGGIMYFTKEHAEGMLLQITSSMDDESVLWFDVPSEAAVTDNSGIREVELFIESMRIIGEPFMLGYDDIEASIRAVGLEVASRASAADVLVSPDPVMSHYSFVLCRKPN